MGRPGQPGQRRSGAHPHPDTYGGKHPRSRERVLLRGRARERRPRSKRTRPWVSSPRWRRSDDERVLGDDVEEGPCGAAEAASRQVGPFLGVARPSDPDRRKSREVRGSLLHRRLKHGEKGPKGNRRRAEVCGRCVRRGNPAESLRQREGSGIHATRCGRGSMGREVCSRVVRVAEVGRRTSDPKKRARLTSLTRRGPSGWPGVSARGSRGMSQGIAPGLRVTGRRESVHAGSRPPACDSTKPPEGALPGEGISDRDKPRLLHGRRGGSGLGGLSRGRCGKTRVESPRWAYERTRQGCQRLDRSVPRGPTIHGGSRAVRRSGRGVVKRQVPWARRVETLDPRKGTPKGSRRRSRVGPSARVATNQEPTRRGCSRKEGNVSRGRRRSDASLLSRAKARRG